MLRDYQLTPWMLGGPPEFFPSELEAIDRQQQADQDAQRDRARGGR